MYLGRRTGSPRGLLCAETPRTAPAEDGRARESLAARSANANQSPIRAVRELIDIREAPANVSGLFFCLRWVPSVVRG